MNRLSKGKMYILEHTFKAVQLSENRTYEIFFESWNKKGFREVMSIFLSNKVEWGRKS